MFFYKISLRELAAYCAQSTRKVGSCLLGGNCIAIAILYRVETISLGLQPLQSKNIQPKSTHIIRKTNPKKIMPAIHPIRHTKNFDLVATK